MTTGPSVETCPQCGEHEDFGSFTDTDGREIVVCGVCSWDSDHGSSTKLCPGGCGSWIDDVLLCCDPCWARIPTRVPGFDRPWRSARRSARNRRHGGDWAWRQFELATNAARDWLVKHPVRT